MISTKHLKPEDPLEVKTYTKNIHAWAGQHPLHLHDIKINSIDGDDINVTIGTQAPMNLTEFQARCIINFQMYA